jgi:hypothetical protein
MTNADELVAHMLAYRKSIRPKKKKTCDLIAKYCGYSATSLKHAEAVIDAAEREPKRYAHLVLEMNGAGNISRAFKRLNADLAARNAKLEK